MKNITLKITGKQFTDDKPEETMEFVTEGRLYDKNGARYLIYDESEFSGFEGCKTSLKFTGDRIRMKRIGQKVGIGMEFDFCEGERFSSEYRTPYGVFNMEMLTNSIEGGLSEEGYGEVRIDYEVSLGGVTEGKNELVIKVME